MKIFAYNLPAFHRIPENDKWWGDGFTEWDNVNNGKPLFKNHCQPMHPLEGEYDLSKIDAVKHQTDLAKQYGVDGFVYYHYWFNGKKIFEKPLELLRDNKDINIEYCFCWANESWTRSWDGKEKEILLRQTFGGMEDWKSHIDYLMTFFKDDRYLKINNMPVLIIYSACKIEKFDEMIIFWTNELKKMGYDGIYLIESINSFNSNVYSKLTNAVTEFEPMYSLKYEISPFVKSYRLFKKKTHSLEKISYDYTWKLLLKRKRKYNGLPIYPGLFVSWDNTPRKGKKGLVITESSPQKFEKFFELLKNNNRTDESKNIYFINAWNEWGEGAVLEPTDKYRFEFLDAIKRIKEK